MPRKHMKTTTALSDGSIVTLSCDADLFSLNLEDRAFVFGLVDLMNDYSVKMAEEGVDQDRQP